MADDVENDDNWLYGENNDNVLKESEEKPPEEPEPPSEPQNDIVDAAEDSEPPTAKSPVDDGPPGVDNEPENNNFEDKEEGEVENKAAEDESENENLDDGDSDDDNVNIVIGDIKTTPSYTSLNVKRSTLVTPATVDKNKQVTGKFSVEEFDQVGLINGVSAVDYNLDSLEDKPWRKPGADITDYFNYGFNEDTWKAYCERQKRIRVSESGVGLQPLNSIGLPRGPVPILNDNSKYSGNFLGANRKAGPPPGRRTMGPIEVIGGNTPRPPDIKENVIQVMMADRREYSRKPTLGFPDMSVPPPNFDQYQPDFGFNPEPEPYYGGYEPTQDSQWCPNSPNWTPVDLKPLTPGPVPPMPHGPPPQQIPMGPPSMQSMPVLPPKERSPRRDFREERDRDRDRDRDSRARSEKPRDRERERSHRRDRSRSRSKRHRTRSRSPSHRQHKKRKSSRRHDDSE